MTRINRKFRKKTNRLIKNRKFVIVFVLLLVVIISGCWYRLNQDNSAPTKDGQPSTSQKQNNNSQTTQLPKAFDKNKYSLNSPTSVWVVVNKGRQLPSDYIPSDLIVPDVALRYSSGGSEMMLRREAGQAIEGMFKTAASEGINLMLASGYRSYNTQSAIYSRHVRDYGRAQADRVSARPGHSEHQTGWSLDVEPTNRACEIEKCFGELPEGNWLAANGYKYGFILRYPSGKEELTGYDYEPWHIRYVGEQLAKEIQNSGQTLEQFFGLPTYSDYHQSAYQLGSG